MTVGVLAAGILSEEEGILWLGHKGEEKFGRKSFLELFSVFTSPPLFLVRHGRRELVFVDETTFLFSPGKAARAAPGRAVLARQRPFSLSSHFL